MKLIVHVLAVISLAVFRTDCRERPNVREMSDDDHNRSDDLGVLDDRDLSNDGELSNVLDLSNSLDVSYGPDLSDGPNSESSTSFPYAHLYSNRVNVDIPAVEVVPGVVPDGFENYDFSVDERVQNEGKLRGGSNCKSDIVCSLLGGSCVTTSTYCSGREVPSVCNGAKCKCCIPVKLEVKIHDLETELRSMAVNLTVANSNLNTKLDSMMNFIISANSSQATVNSNLDLKMDSIMSTNSNLTIANSNMDLKIDSIINSNSKLSIANSDMNEDLEFIKENLTNANANQDSKLESIMEHQGCPEGLFFFPPSNQCFRLLNDTWRNYDNAKAACRALGLQLAHPYDPLSLRSYLTTRHGLTHFTWLGARGTGTAITWERTGKAISAHSPLWETGRPGSYVSSSWCLLLSTAEHRWKNQPTQTYYNQVCSSGEWTLCEYVSE